MYKRIILLVLFALSFSFAQDQIPGTERITIPESIQSLYTAINNAEQNGDWTAYNQLRSQIISEWQKINPEVAKLYRNVNDGTPDLTPDGMPADHPRTNIDDSKESILFESPNVQSNASLWGDDVMITGGKAYDISMDISRDGEIYIAVDGRLDGSATKDSVYIYKSVDGGLTWTQWSSVYATTQTFKQVELMCFDGYPGSTGDSYLLLFFVFDSGWLRVGRTLTSTPSWSYYTIAGSANGGFPTDFAVDRNYPGADYRAFCVYDSSNVIKSIRSEATSNGTVWQDAGTVGSATVGRGDLDICYGLNGGVYVTFNGFNSGNLYTIENTSYADPASWGTLNTVVTGSTDTTRHAEIISTRDNIPANIVSVVFELQSGSTFDLYEVMKPSGSSTWGSMAAWVVPDENKWPSLYSRKVNGNQVFEGVFEQSLEGNFPPRSVKYKAYDGSIWSQSLDVSDFDVTGLQKPEVGDLDGSTPVYSYVGANYVGVYFDNFGWTPTDVENETTPTEFSLEQNYPNPFNPSTLIKFTLPENSNVKIKVYDVIGTEVATLLSETVTAGSHEVNFNANKLSSGVYFYKLEAIPVNGEKAFVQTKKMMLIK